MKHIKTILFLMILIGFLNFQFNFDSPNNFASAEQMSIDYDSYKLDPYDDIRIMSTTDILTPVEGFEYIDITKLESYQPVGELGVIREFEVNMELTVDTAIMDRSDVYYMYILNADDEDYIITYNNGSAEGQSMDDPFGPSFKVDYEIVNSNTLVITLNLLSVGNPQEIFEWSAWALVIGDDSNQFMDKAPDKILLITAPTDQGTVHSTIEIEGITKRSLTAFENVEYQIDTQYPANWNSADSDSGNWSSWSFGWDTTEVTDEEPHMIHVRGYDGEYYYEDSITVYVIQSNKDNPATIETVPDILSGDTFYYTSTHDPTYMGLQLELITDMTETVVGNETVTFEGVTYDVWKREIEGEGVVTYANIPIDFELDGISLLTKDNYEMLYTEDDININVPLAGSIETTTILRYSPPRDMFNFPMSIGELWYSENEVSTTTIIRYSGDVAEDTSEDDIEYQNEALHAEQTVVPAGTFETFVFRSQQKESDIYELFYYSDELGNFIRVESYDNNRELLERIDLEEYTKGKGSFIEIKDITTDPSEPRVDEKVKIKVGLKNKGTSNTTEDIILEINGAEISTRSVTFDSTEETEVTFTWTPKKTGNYQITIKSPDDELSKNIDVAEAEVSGLSDILSSPLFILIALIILFLVVFGIVYAVKRSKKDYDIIAPDETGPSVFDVDHTTSESPSRGTIQALEKRKQLNEPKVITYSKALSQVGGSRTGVMDTINCPECAFKIALTSKTRPKKLSCPRCGHKF